MMHQFRGILFAIAAVFTPLATQAAPEADFQRFLSWWPGDYDNLAQVQAQETARTPAKDRNQATFLYIRKVNLPAFGPEAYYAEWRDAKTPTKVTRQRIYGFEVDGTTKKLRLNLHIWPNDKPDFVARTSGAYFDPSKLDGVTPADMAGLKGCDVFFDSKAKEFSGAMIKGACAFPAPNGAPIYSWSQMKLTDKQFSYLDGWFNLDGTVFQRLSADWYVFEKKK